jgi:hypothetical protein
MLYLFHPYPHQELEGSFTGHGPEDPAETILGEIGDICQFFQGKGSVQIPFDVILIIYDFFLFGK